MIPELNREYPELDNQEIFQEMAAIVREQIASVGGHLRGQHAKATGCVEAEFRIADEVRSDLRHGIFSQPGRIFTAIARFSNSSNTIEKDGAAAARGSAIKLPSVAGDPAQAQDFLMVNSPIFPFRDPDEYVAFMKRRQIGHEISPKIGDVIAAAHLALTDFEALKKGQAIKGAHVANPLEVTYFSGSPYWLGQADGTNGHAVKYMAVSRGSGRTPIPEHPDREDANYLAHALAEGLKVGEAVFDFNVQLQRDPVRMPVENPSIDWSEAQPEVHTVATLHIRPQPVDPAGDLATRCESMSFSPWHALAEHRPMGGMNRLRKVVYEASRLTRHAQ